MDQVLEFTKRYHNILAAINAVQFDLTKNPVELRKFADDGIKEAAAHELYRQFFGLMFDEFVAYQHGFLGRDAFTKWMKWRNVDASKFEILGVGYMKGWNNWVRQTPFKQHDFITHLEDVHEPGLSNAQIERLVLRHGSKWVRQTPFIQHDFITFMEDVHEPGLSDAQIERLVVRHGSFFKRSTYAIRGFAAEIAKWF
jgi:hypothetical protein